MESTPAPKNWSTPMLITIAVGVLVGVVSFGGIISQWGQPTTAVSTASFFGVLLGILIFAAGCIWLVIKLLLIIFRTTSRP